MCYLLSLSPEWNLYKKDLSKRSKDGYDSMVAGWNELEELGYIESIQIRINGQFKGYDYLITVEPVGEIPEQEISEQGNPRLIKNLTKKELNKEIDSKKESINVELFPTQPVIKISFTEKCNKFIEIFNKIRGGKFKLTTKVKTALKARLKTHSANEIIQALKTAMLDKYHIENNYMYLTPEFILREDKLERYLNLKNQTNQLQLTGENTPQTQGAQL